MCLYLACARFSAILTWGHSDQLLGIWLKPHSTTIFNNKIANGILCDTACGLCQGFLYSQDFEWYTGTCNFIAPTKKYGLPVLTFIKLTHTQQHYMQISYSIFHENLKINLKGTDRNSFRPTVPSKICPSLCQFYRTLSNSTKIFWPFFCPRFYALT
jgi:hypothetical protein